MSLFFDSLNTMASEDIKSKDQPFYLPLSKHLPTTAFRELLEKYSKIPASEVDAHLEEVVSSKHIFFVLGFPF